MYSNLPFTGAPFAYIALAVVFIAAGFITRIWAKMDLGNKLNNKNIEIDS